MQSSNIRVRPPSFIEESHETLGSAVNRTLLLNLMYCRHVPTLHVEKGGLNMRFSSFKDVGQPKLSLNLDEGVGIMHFVHRFLL